MTSPPATGEIRPSPPGGPPQGSGRRPQKSAVASSSSKQGGVPVPKFMDVHDDLKLPGEAIQQIAQDTKDAKADKFGVRQIELFHNPEGKVFCLLEAPDAEAVRSHHAALGVPCGDVHEVSGLL
jgi:hypothetical protein